jgi:hypothetical protein
MAQVVETLRGPEFKHHYCQKKKKKKAVIASEWNTRAGQEVLGGGQRTSTEAPPHAICVCSMNPQVTL